MSTSPSRAGRWKLTVEACVRAWKSVLRSVVSVDVESAEAVHTFKLLESVERDLASSRDELQQLGLLFLVERSHGAPEPSDLRRGSSVVVVLGIALPIIHVDFWQSGDQKLKFLLVENGDELRGDNVMET